MGDGENNLNGVRLMFDFGLGLGTITYSDPLKPTLTHYGLRCLAVSAVSVVSCQCPGTKDRRRVGRWVDD